MKKIAAAILMVSLVFACAAPVYATHHMNKQARAAQKRNKSRARQLKKERRAHQKAANHQTASR